MTFASYMPAENGDPTADVTFRIIQDGYTDLITICSYTYDAGGDRADSFAEARIYRGNEGGHLVYESDMSAEANSALTELTTSSVLGFLGVER